MEVQDLEYFFGMSSLLQECSCERKYGTYNVIEHELINKFGFGLGVTKDVPTWFKYCPNCRVNNAERPLKSGTLADLIKKYLEDRSEIPSRLTSWLEVKGYPKANEFIDFCLGRTKLYFGKKGEDKQSKETPICGVCGSKMLEENGEYKCKTCERFFGVSSMGERCRQCGQLYGVYPWLDRFVDYRATISTYNPDVNKWKETCPRCRKDLKNRYGYSISKYTTVSKIVKEMVERRQTSPYYLEHLGLPKEFIDYCLGRMKPYSERK